MAPFTLRDFVSESNRIEGMDEARAHEIEAHATLLAVPRVDIIDLRRFVSEIGGGPLRELSGMDVRVGAHRPRPGGPMVLDILTLYLQDINARCVAPYEIHRDYEYLHPFMDGNGRSGRALWLWQMGGIEKAPLGFLHSYYYQSLEAAR